MQIQRSNFPRVTQCFFDRLRQWFIQGPCSNYSFKRTPSNKAQPAFSCFSRVKGTPVDDLVFVPFLISNFSDDLVNGRSLLRTRDRQFVLGQHGFRKAFGLGVYGNVISGSSLNKSDSIFAYWRRGEKPRAKTLRKARFCQMMVLLVDSTRESRVTVFNQFLRLCGCHRGWKGKSSTNE